MASVTTDAPETVEEQAVTVIAEDLHIKGTVTFKTSLMIKGSLEGEILSEGLLLVGPTAKINATIVTQSLISNGDINGDVTASDNVILRGTAVHKGNISTPRIIVESGSLFNGSCIMVRKEEPVAEPAGKTEKGDAAKAEATGPESTAGLSTETASPAVNEERNIAEEPANPLQDDTVYKDEKQFGSWGDEGLERENGGDYTGSKKEKKSLY